MSSSVARYVHRAHGDTTLSNSGDEKSDSAAHPAKGEDTHRHSWEGLVTQTTSHDIADSDETLVALVRSGDREALGALFHRYARIVRGLAYRVLRDTSEADDLLQDIFLLVHRLCGTFDRSKGSARFWILQMTYRRAISRRRYLTSRHFYTHLDLDEAANRFGEPHAGSGGPESSMNDTLDRREALQSCFTGLSECQRQTLHLFFYEGYTFEEIAAKLGQTVGNARNHYYRGLDKLRKQVSANCRAKKQHDTRP
jgi:RNA polymerase sigma-70 factor (ECF subfamily)